MKLPFEAFRVGRTGYHNSGKSRCSNCQANRFSVIHFNLPVKLRPNDGMGFNDVTDLYAFTVFDQVKSLF